MLMDSSNRGSTLSEKDWPALLRDSSRTGGQNSQAFKKPGGARWQAKVDGITYAVNIETGALKWKQSLGGRIYSTAYATEQHVFIGCGDGYVYGLDAKTGKIAWKTGTGNGIDSSPAVVGETVLVGSNDFFFYALNAADGSIQWKYEAGLGISSAPAVSGNLVFFGSKDG